MEEKLDRPFHLKERGTAAGYASLLPDFSNGLAVPSLAPTIMKMDFSHIGVTFGRHSQTTRRRMPPIEKE